MQQIERIEDLLKFRGRCFVAETACDVSECAHTVFIRAARGLKHLFRRKQIVGFNSGVVVSALRAESAVLRTDSGFGVQNRTRSDLARELPAYLVRQRNQVENIFAIDLFGDFERLFAGENSAVQHFVSIFYDRVQHGNIPFLG